MKKELTVDELYELDIDEVVEEMNQGCYNPLEALASLRHQAHCGRLNNTRDINECLSELGINIKIEDIENVHDIINPILIGIENRYKIDGLASHGIAAMNAYGH